jgi:nucleoside-diphosphate-sugar epimerase
MNALITGANGFLGTWLARALVARGDTLACLLRPTSDVSGLAGLTYTRVEGDVTDPASLERAVAGRDVVFHLAGIRRAAARDDFMRVHAEGTRNVCEALLRTGGKARLVLCSSLAACGPSTLDRPRVEEDPYNPAEWYGESKVEAERITLSYADRLPVTIARPPRILGPGDHENLTFFKLMKRGIRLEIGGGPRPLSLIDVEDVVDLLLLLAERKEALGQAFFAAGSRYLTLEELQDVGARELGVRPRTVRLAPWMLRGMAATADVITQVTGRKLPLNRKLARQLLAPAWTCSGAKAERLLGFRPRREPEDSVRRSTRWYLEHGWL